MFWYLMFLGASSSSRSRCCCQCECRQTATAQPWLPGELRPEVWLFFSSLGLCIAAPRCFQPFSAIFGPDGLSATLFLFIGVLGAVGTLQYFVAMIDVGNIFTETSHWILLTSSTIAITSEILTQSWLPWIILWVAAWTIVLRNEWRRETARLHEQAAAACATQAFSD